MTAWRLSAATKTIQSENNLLLLQFLSIGGMVASRKEWAQGALDWLRSAGRSNYFSNLMTATHSVDGRCLTVLRVGSRDQISITEFGRMALELDQPVWIREPLENCTPASIDGAVQQ